MAQNFISEGEVMPYVVPTGATVTAGQVVVSGSLIGIALGGGTEGQTIQVMLTGVFEVPKNTSQAWTQGAPIYITSGGAITTSASGNTLIGHAFAAAATNAETGQLKLLR